MIRSGTATAMTTTDESRPETRSDGSGASDPRTDVAREGLERSAAAQPSASVADTWSG